MMEAKTYPAGSILFQEGDSGDIAYLVESGSVEISRGEGKARTVLGKVGVGAMFGEMALVSDQKRMATATATVETDMSLLCDDGRIVTLTHIIGNRFIQELLGLMTRFPLDRYHLSLSGLKELPPFCINSFTFFSANDIWGNPFTGNTFYVRERNVIYQGHKAMEGICLSLMRCC